MSAKYSSIGLAAVLFIGASGMALAADPAPGECTIRFETQRRDPQTDKIITTFEEVPASKTAIVIVDIWDYHWCTTWCGRAATMIPRLNKVLEVTRELGVTTVHSPTDCSAGQAGMPQRELMAALPHHAKPKPLDFNPPAPWSFGLGSGCMCGGPYPCVVNYFNYRQDPRVIILPGDYISSGDQELHNLCQEKGITHLVYTGGATNMCLCQKPEGMIGMTRLGYKCILARDITQAHGPNSGAEHADRNTAFSIAYIEKHIGASTNLVETLRKMGKWDDRWIVDSVMLGPWGQERRPKFFNDTLTLSMSSPLVTAPGAKIHYTLDGGEPTPQSPVYTKPFAIDRSVHVRAKAFKDNRAVSLESKGWYCRLIPVPPQPQVFLSDLQPFKQNMDGWSEWYDQGPLFPPPQLDRSLAGQPLVLRGATYKKGLGLRAPSHVLYHLKPEYKAFVARVGVDESCLKNDNGRGRAGYPSVIFRVFIDGRLAAESPIMRIAQEPWRFNVEIPPGSRVISLAATDAGDGNREDMCCWADAGFTVSAESAAKLLAEEAAAKGDALGKKATFLTQPAPPYAGPGAAALTDGLRRALQRREGCLGYEGIDCDVVIDLERPTAIRSLAVSCLQDAAGGIYLPGKVEFSVSDDGETFRPAGSVSHDVSTSSAGPLARLIAINNLDLEARYVRARAVNIGAIPAGHPSAGAKAWLFVDEVLVNSDAKS